MFFYISGFANSFYNCDKGFVVYTVGKAKRLLIPFNIGFFLILPVRLYLAQSYQVFAKVCCDEKGEHYIEHNFFVYYFKIFPNLIEKLSWLWFLLALFIDSLINYPMMAWTQRRVQKKPFDHNDIMYFAGMAISRFIWMGVCSFCPPLNDKEVGLTELWPQIAMQFLFYCAIMFVQFLLNEDRPWLYFAIKAFGPICCVLMNIFKNGENFEAVYGFLSMVNYDIVFMAQGIVDCFYWKEQDSFIKNTLVAKWGPLMNFNMVIISTTMPTVTHNEGFLWFYPLYFPFWLQSYFVIGGWYSVYYICYTNSLVTNSKFNVDVYNWVNGVSLWGYLSHYLFIVLIVVLIIRPLNLTVGPAIVINFSLSLILINLSYLLIVKCTKKKKRGEKKEKANGNYTTVEKH